MNLKEYRSPVMSKRDENARWLARKIWVALADGQMDKQQAIAFIAHEIEGFQALPEVEDTALMWKIAKALWRFDNPHQGGGLETSFDADRDTYCEAARIV